MAADVTESGSETSGSAATIVLKLQPADQSAGLSREDFWGSVSQRTRSSFAGPAAETFEARIRSRFADQLETRFRRFLAGNRGQAAGVRDAAQAAALARLRIRVADIAYGSIEIKTIIDNLDLIIDAFALTLDVVTGALTALSPDALNAALDTPDLPWSVTLPVVDVPGLPAQPHPATPGPDPRGFARLWALLASPTFLWKLFNALWALPILVSLAVLILITRDLMAISAARDEDRGRIISGEAARAAALLERFEKQHEALLIRHDTAMKEAAETARVILNGERDRVQARMQSLDHQQLLLMQRYDALIRDQSDLVKTLLQRPEPCCKSAGQAGKTTKPRCTVRTARS